jgi:hypothetical protein
LTRGQRGGKCHGRACVLLQPATGKRPIAGVVPEVFSNPPGLVYRASFEIMQELARQKATLLAENGLSVMKAEDAAAELNSARPDNAPPGGLLNILWQSSQYAKTQLDQRPSTVKIITDLAVAAQNYVPELYGASAAATKSNKNNRRIQYIRAFGIF